MTHPDQVGGELVICWKRRRRRNKTQRKTQGTKFVIKIPDDYYWTEGRGGRGREKRQRSLNTGESDALTASWISLLRELSWQVWSHSWNASRNMLSNKLPCAMPMMHEWAEGHVNPQSCSGARHLRIRSLEIRGDSRKGSQGTWGPTVDCRSPTGSGEFLAHWRAGLKGTLLLDPTRGGGRLLEMTGVGRGGNGSP